MLCCALWLMWAPATAGDVSFQPRLEAGLMYYSFESEVINEHLASAPIPVNTGADNTQNAFEFSDTLPFIGAGATFFSNRFFIDFSGQYAYNGKDTTSILNSAYVMEFIDYDALYMNTGFMAMDTCHTAKINRRDMAVSLGWAVSRRLSLFAGYKWARTHFKTTSQGRYSIVRYSSDSDMDGYSSGRSWGLSDYRFAYAGPFIGAVQSWDCRHRGFLSGMFTANLALAHLEGKVVLERRDQYWTITSIDGQPVTEVIVHVEDAGFVRYNTKGDAWGLTLGIGWRGETALEGLSYFLGLSGYRYEFNAEENSQSDINETAVRLKAGLVYIF
jgi:hypothetical protein